MWDYQNESKNRHTASKTIENESEHKMEKLTHQLQDRWKWVLECKTWNVKSEKWKVNAPVLKLSKISAEAQNVKTKHKYSKIVENEYEITKLEKWDY
jgi:hypothetical protein